jgi:hypothetical protein
VARHPPARVGAGGPEEQGDGNGDEYERDLHGRLRGCLLGIGEDPRSLDTALE